METYWTWNNPVIVMQRVIVDACGWVAVIEAGINIDQALMESFGSKNLALVPKVLEELESLNDKKLMIPMLISKSESFIPSNVDSKHTDDLLFALSIEKGWPVLTVDTQLKRRLSQANQPWIEVIGNSHLRFVN